MTDYTEWPPQPVPDSDSQAYWRATAVGRIELCRCVACGVWHHPPLEHCRSCAAPTRFEAIAAGGAIRSFIVARHLVVPGYRSNQFYVIALVELDEQPGLRLVGQLVGTEPEAVEIGQRVVALTTALPPGDFHVVEFRIDTETRSFDSTSDGRSPNEVAP